MAKTSDHRHQPAHDGLTSAGFGILEQLGDCHHQEGFGTQTKYIPYLVLVNIVGRWQETLTYSRVWGYYKVPLLPAAGPSMVHPTMGCVQPIGWLTVASLGP